MKPKYILTHAYCVFRNEGAILVVEGFDSKKHQMAYSLIGGEVPFGEHSIETVIRVVNELLDVEIMDLRSLGTLENLSEEDGQLTHEISLIYEADFVDESIYENGHIDLIGDQTSKKLVWMPLDAFQPGVFPLQPGGLYEMLVKKQSLQRKRI